MKESTFLKLNWKDVLKGFITAFITALLTSVYQIIGQGNWPTGDQLRTALLIGLGAGIAYLLKNWLTNSEDEFLKKEQ